MDLEEIEIGAKVCSNRDFQDVPCGTEGFIVKDYGEGILIAWDLPNKPYPSHLTPEQVANMWAANPECPFEGWIW